MSVVKGLSAERSTIKGVEPYLVLNLAKKKLFRRRAFFVVINGAQERT